MKKEKSYERTRFPSRVIRRALETWEQQFSSESGEVKFWLLSLTQSGETWEHDELESFLHAYDEGFDQALIVARLEDESKFSVSHTPYSCSIGIEGRDKNKIESIFDIFEEAISSGSFESLESQGAFGEKALDPDSGAHNQSRRFEIKDKIIKVRDLVKLAKHLEATVQGGASDRKSIDFEIQWANNSSINLSDSESFERELNDANASLNMVDLRCRDYSRGREVVCQLTHGNSYHDNRLVVSGPNRQWVTDSYTRAKEIVDSFQPQKTIYRRIEPILVLATFVLCGWAAQKVGIPLVDYFFEPSTQPERSTAASGFFFLFGIPLGLIVGLWLWNLPKSAFPDIEFQVGPEHTHKEARFRLLVAFILGAIVLPIAIEWFF